MRVTQWWRRRRARGRLLRALVDVQAQREQLEREYIRARMSHGAYLVALWMIDARTNMIRAQLNREEVNGGKGHRAAAADRP